MLIVAMACMAGWFAREYTASNKVTRAVHTIEDTAKTVQTDHVALARDLARRERRDQEMFELFDKVLSLIEADMQNKKVAVEQQNR